ncbi:hypothetical protein BN946_scf185001.g33 [Trametes cinnabarina]|uniref:Auxilliary Activities Family 9 protein n=1 Tax=Pycnoporus cinnabarinus TaxID=5643 RepID=A0A060SK86_PYCCI|nr:hypothetical protein BN946_scf185001.g33 [Trametes cinnabarina]
MKCFAAIASVASFASLAAAQGVLMLSPPPESTFAPGDKFVVDVDRPDPNATCDGIDSSLEIGTVLYAGPYTPQIRPGGDDLFQNFTVEVPTDFPAGAAVLSVAHFFLDGARAWPVLQVLNETVHITQ